jgi:hypothetical protein
MKTWREVRKLALVLALAVPVAAAARPGGGAGGCPCGEGPGKGAGARMLEGKALTTVEGEIAAVERVERRRHAGVHLTLATASGSVPVRLGPDFYVDEQALKLGKGDRVVVKGYDLDLDGERVVVAAEVRRGDAVLALRGEDGAPLWRGQGRGRR